VITLTPGIQIEVEIGGGWSPLSLSNLVAYYNASMGVTQSSGNVSQWNDQSGNGYNLTVPGGGPPWTSPVYSSTGFNSSYPGITYTDGSNQSLDSAASVTMESGNFSIWMLANTPVFQSSNYRYFGLLANGGGVDYENNGICLIDSIAAPGYGAFQVDYLGNSVGSANVPQLVGFVGSSAGVQPYLAATAEGSPASAITVGSSPNTIGIGNTQPIGGSPCTNFTIAFFILTAAAMSAGDISNLKTWTNNNWGTSF
jgi:hypothetical protein